MNVYDFKQVTQKAPMTGKIASRAGSKMSRAGGENRLRSTTTNFGSQPDKIAKAQSRMTQKPSTSSDPEKKIRAMEAEINGLID